MYAKIEKSNITVEIYTMQEAKGHIAFTKMIETDYVVRNLKEGKLLNAYSTSALKVKNLLKDCAEAGLTITIS
jgi:hypothetical protein